MTYALVFFALVLGFMVGKDFKSQALYDDIKAKERALESKEHELKYKDSEIRFLTKTINQLQVTYPEIRDTLSSSIIVNTDEALTKAIEALKPSEKNLKTLSQYEHEISELKDKVSDYQTRLYLSETSGRYVLAFRNIVIRNADKLKDEVRVISSINYDHSIPHGGADIEIEFLKSNLPNYKEQYLN